MFRVKLFKWEQLGKYEYKMELKGRENTFRCTYNLEGLLIEDLAGHNGMSFNCTIQFAELIIDAVIDANELTVPEKYKMI